MRNILIVKIDNRAMDKCTDEMRVDKLDLSLVKQSFKIRNICIIGSLAI